MIRLFAAVDPPEAVRERLALVQAGLPAGRLVDPDSMHVTLGFFGEVDQPLARDIDAALSGVRAPGFDLALDGVDAFGGDRPRVIFARVAPDERLERLQAKVIQAAREAGAQPPARRFTPHVTLARLNGAPADKRLSRWLADRTAFLAGPQAVDHFSLYRSDLGRRGPTYTELARYDLTE